MDFNQLRDSTIQKSCITCTEGYFRFVNHIDKIATTGYKFENTLWIRREDFRFDAITLREMKTRYAEIYGKNLLPMYQVIKKDVSNALIVALVAKPHRSEEIANSIAKNCNRFADVGYSYEVLPVTLLESLAFENI